MKSKLENEDLIKVLKFCKENNVEMRFNCNAEDSVDMTMHKGYVVYKYMFFKDDIEASGVNVTEIFLEKANNELHSVPDPDIYNYSRKTRVVCYDYLDGDEKYRYVVMSVNGHHPTVYIQFPGIEKIESYDDVMSPKVHGGFTFLGELKFLPYAGVWLGWNYAHYGDYIFTNWNLDPRSHIWTKKELAADAVSTLSRIKKRGMVVNAIIGRAE